MVDEGINEKIIRKQCVIMINEWIKLTGQKFLGKKEKFLGKIYWEEKLKLNDGHSQAVLNIFWNLSKHWLKWPSIELNRAKNCFPTSISS